MKVIGAGLSFSVLLIVLVAGAFKGGGQCKTLNPADQIALNGQGRQSGQFNGPDLSVNYTYFCTGSDMQLTGDVQFGMLIQANHAVVQTFLPGQARADGQGDVLGEQQHTSVFDDNVGDTIKFGGSVVVPPQTAPVVFYYTVRHTRSAAATRTLPIPGFTHSPIRFGNWRGVKL